MTCDMILGADDIFDSTQHSIVNNANHDDIQKIIRSQELIIQLLTMLTMMT